MEQHSLSPEVNFTEFILSASLCDLTVYMPGATFIAPGFVLYIFTNVGTYSFVVPTGKNVTVDVLIVAGGGGGGGGGQKGGIFKNASFPTYSFV